MKLIIGLGNPGEKYEKTRHNAGFLAVDKVVSSVKYQVLNTSLKFNAEISHGVINNEKIILAKPQTFMNNSGQAIQTILDYYKISLEDIIVIHDDLDIAIGKYKISKNRGSAGHKGVQSIIDYLGTKDFMRIRIGIGENSKVQDLANSRVQISTSKKIPVEKFVLEKFSTEEILKLEKVFSEIANDIEDLFE